MEIFSFACNEAFDIDLAFKKKWMYNEQYTFG